MFILCFFSYYKSQEKKKVKEDEAELSDDGTISDTEFDEYLFKTEVDGADGNDDLELDYAEYGLLFFLILQ